MSAPAQSDHDFDEQAIHQWFGLTYAAYLVVPRSLLQSLPGPLQRALVDALQAIELHLQYTPVPKEGHYEVQLRADAGGRYLEDPLRDYQRGRRHVSLEELR